jgi:hypothetical protein
VRRGKFLLAGAIVAALALMSVLPAAAQSSNEKPQATEVGVNANELHIAVVADVDNSLAPNLFKGAVDGVKAGAAYVNSKAGGGGAGGRKVVVDFYDAKLNANEARNATIKACENDLAMVGTMVLFLTSVDDMTNCKDKAGAATGLPDISSTAVGMVEGCAPTSFPAIGTQLQCDTITQSPQVYNGNQASAKYLLSVKKGLHGPFVIGSDTKDSARGGTVLSLTMQQAGIKADQGTTVGKSGRDPQSAYTSVVNQMKADGSNFGYSANAATGTDLFRSEAQLQGLTGVTWSCGGCYNSTPSLENSSVWEGEYTDLQFLPFNETGANPTLKAFVNGVKKQGGTPDQFSIYGFGAVLAFRDAVNATVKANGVNGITRANVITGIKTLTDFDAEGILGTHSFKNAQTTACSIEAQMKSGKWTRLAPKKSGTFDCNPKNHVDVKADLLNK